MESQEAKHSTYSQNILKCQDAAKIVIKFVVQEVRKTSMYRGLCLEFGLNNEQDVRTQWLIFFNPLKQLGTETEQGIKEKPTCGLHARSLHCRLHVSCGAGQLVFDDNRRQRAAVAASRVRRFQSSDVPRQLSSSLLLSLY